MVSGVTVLGEELGVAQSRVGRKSREVLWPVLLNNPEVRSECEECPSASGCLVGGDPAPSRS